MSRKRPPQSQLVQIETVTDLQQIKQGKKRQKGIKVSVFNQLRCKHSLLTALSQESLDWPGCYNRDAPHPPTSTAARAARTQRGSKAKKKNKPALFLILATTRKAWPAVSRLARRDGTVGARRGHLSSSKREMRGPARAGPAAPATPTRGCASSSGCCSQGWLRGLSSLLFLPRGFLQSPRHKELRLLHHTGP